MPDVKPAQALGRFMLAIYDYYKDRGMQIKTAKARMYDEALDQAHTMMSKEADIPDHALAIAMTFVSRMLNSRGIKLANKLRTTEYLESDDTQKLRRALHDIKTAKDAVDTFISSYKGETTDGKS